jgi:hypothetical protein
MSEGFKRLKNIGAQKIHDDTHISLQYVTSILEEDYSSLTKVQFLGFISILEREYHIDLSEYKDDISIELFKEHTPYKSSESHLFVVPKRQKNFTSYYIFVAIVIVGFVAFESIDFTPSTINSYSINDNKMIKDAKVEVEKKLQKDEREEKMLLRDTNVTQTALIDENKTEKQPETNSSIEKSNVEEEKLQTLPQKEIKDKQPLPVGQQELTIHPKSKVWFGYIDIKTGKKKSVTIKDSFDLKLEDDYLFVFGHGRVELDLDGEVYNFNGAQTLRLLYKDGTIKKISVTEFKALNKGRKW